MRRVLGLSVGFGLACSGLGEGLPGAPPKEEETPELVAPAAPAAFLLGGLRTEDAACRIEVAPFGEDGEVVLLATLPKPCPANRRVALASSGDRLLVSLDNGAWIVDPATGAIVALPELPDRPPQRVALDNDIALACTDLSTDWKVDGEQIVVAWKGKDTRAPAVDGAVGYALSRVWRFDGRAWVGAEPVVTALTETDRVGCDEAPGWPEGDQRCLGCEGVGGGWRAPNEVETAALAALGAGPWTVSAGADDRGLLAVGETLDDAGVRAWTRPVVAVGPDGTWTQIEAGEGPVVIAPLGAGTWAFFTDAGWKIVSGGKTSEIEGIPFVWPEGLPSTPAGAPAEADPAPVAGSPSPRPDRDRPAVRPATPERDRDPNTPPKVRPGEGKVGKGEKAKAKAKAKAP